MIDSTRSWLLIAIQWLFNHIFFRFDTGDVIWCRQKCVPWLIISIKFTSSTYWFEMMVYLKIMMSWLVIHLVYNMSYWFAGDGFRCSSAVCLFWVFFNDFLKPLEPRYEPIYNVRRSMNDCFIFGTLNPECTNEKFDSMYGLYGYRAKNVLEIAIFMIFLKNIFGLRVHISPQGPQNPFLKSIVFLGQN